MSATPPSFGLDVDLDDSGDARALTVSLVGDDKRVLELAPNSERVCRALQRGGCHVVAVDGDRATCAALRRAGTEAICTDARQSHLGAQLRWRKFDVFLLGTLLQQQRDPLAMLKRLMPFLGKRGAIVASFYNVAHASVRLSLLDGSFSRHEGSLLDVRHVQLFDLPAVQQMFDDAGLTIETIERVVSDPYRDPCGGGDAWDATAIPDAVKMLIERDPEAAVAQYVVRARRADQQGARSQAASSALVGAAPGDDRGRARELRVLLSLADRLELDSGERETREALEQSRQRVAKLEKELDDARRSVDAGDERSAELERQRERVERELAERDRELAGALERAQRSEAELEGARAESGAELERARAESAAELERARAELERARAASEAEHERARAELQGRCSELQGEQQSQRAELEQLRDELAQTERQVGERGERVQQLAEQIDQARQRLAEATSRERALAQQNEQLERATAIASQRQQQRDEQLRRAEQLLALRCGQLDQQRAQLALARGAAAAQAAQLARAREELGEVGEVVQRQRELLDEQRRAAEQSGARVEQLEQQCASLQRQARRVAELETECAALAKRSQRSEQLERALLDHQGRIEQLQRELARVEAAGREQARRAGQAEQLLGLARQESERFEQLSAERYAAAQQLRIDLAARDTANAQLRGALDEREAELSEQLRLAHERIERQAARWRDLLAAGRRDLLELQRRSARETESAERRADELRTEVLRARRDAEQRDATLEAMRQQVEQDQRVAAQAQRVAARRAAALEARLSELRDHPVWRAVRRLERARDLMLPAGTRRRALYDELFAPEGSAGLGHADSAAAAGSAAARDEEPLASSYAAASAASGGGVRQHQRSARRSRDGAPGLRVVS